MEKKQYVKPLAEKMKFKLANLMITARVLEAITTPTCP